MTFAFPPMSPDDRLSDAVAVWRDTPCPDRSARQVTVDYGGGLVEQTTADAVHWGMVKRWRWGHAP